MKEFLAVIANKFMEYFLLYTPTSRPAKVPAENCLPKPGSEARTLPSVGNFSPTLTSLRPQPATPEAHFLRRAIGRYGLNSS